MKKILSLLLIAAGLTVAAQPKKAPKMAPILAEGYYVGSKNDTVRGEVQTNPEDVTDFYSGFYFVFKYTRHGSKFKRILIPCIYFY